MKTASLRGMLCIFGMLAMLGLGVPKARADQVTYDINYGDTTISAFTGSYVQVTVDLTDSTHATITFTSQTVGSDTYYMGSTGAAGVNVNETGTSFNVTNVSPSATIQSYAAGTASPFGSFNLMFTNQDSGSKSVSTISFTLTNVGGTWSSASDVLTPNTTGYTVESYIFVNQLNADADKGFAAGTYPIPEPASLLLLGTGLLGLGAIRWRTKKRRARRLKPRFISQPSAQL